MSEAHNVIRRFTETWNADDPSIDDLAAPGFMFTGDPMHLGVSQGPVSLRRMRDEVPGKVVLIIRELIDVDEERVLVLGMGDLESEAGGFAQELAWIVTVRDGRVAASEGFADQAAARRAAGLD